MKAPLSIRHAKVKSLFLQARGLAGGQQASFLDEACDGDESLKEQVRRLLLQDTRTVADLLDAPPVALTELGHVGRYRLLRKLGEGGMGSVFEAEQPNPTRLVALKVMRAGRFASEHSIRLFEREIQALARLRHPRIASIYEAGCTEDGHHFFTMELASGDTLHDYLSRRNLTVRESVALALKICEAVTYAHQHGVIHRDLKPTNIMVHRETGHADVKVLDFGLARVNDDTNTDEALTQAGTVQGTLPYMSPEQVRGNRDEIDLRTDVYALGVILYEMLSGQLPLKLGGLALGEAARVIQQDRPIPLQKAASRRLDADLCTVVHKALEKEPARRYSSASAFADDLSRYLDNQPIQALPPSSVYELRKLVARNKLIFGLVAATVLVVVAFAISASLQAQRIASERDRAVAAERMAVEGRQRALAAEGQAAQERNHAVASERKALLDRNLALREKQRADAEAATANAISDFLQKDLLEQAQAVAQAGPNRKPDPDLKVRTAVERAAARIEGKFAAQPQVEASIRHTLGKTYWNLGLLSNAETHLARALDLRRRHLGEDHPNTLASTNDLGSLLRVQGKYVQAEPLLVRTLEGRRRLLGEEHPETLVSVNNLGSLYRSLGNYPLTEKMYAKSLEIRRRVHGENHPSTAIAFNNLGALFYYQGKYPQAQPLYLKSLEIRRRALGEDHPATGTALSNLGLLHHAQHQHSQAAPLLEKALALRRAALGPENSDTVNSIMNLGLCYLSARRFQDAEPLISEVALSHRRLSGEKHPATADAVATLADVRIHLNKYSEAGALLREACPAEVRATTWSHHYCQSLRGALLAAERNFEAAEPLLVSGFLGLVQQKAKMPPERLPQIEQAHDRVVQFYSDWGKPELADQWKQRHFAKNQ